MTAPAFILPRPMRASDAAGYLGMSRSKFVSLWFPAKREGRTRLYDRLDLDAYPGELPHVEDRDKGGRDTNGFKGLVGVRE